MESKVNWDCHVINRDVRGFETDWYVIMSYYCGHVLTSINIRLRDHVRGVPEMSAVHCLI